MRVDNAQLFEVVGIRFGAERTAGVTAGVREVVHAGIQGAAVSRLMVETEGVRYLLTHYVLPLIRIVVGGGVEVAVVHLGRALRDVRAVYDVNRGQPEPAVEAVAAVTDLSGAGDHSAALG